MIMLPVDPKKFCKRCVSLYGRLIPQSSQELAEQQEHPLDEKWARVRYTAPGGSTSSYCLGCQSEKSAEHQRTKRLIPLLQSLPVPEHARPLLALHLTREIRKSLRYQDKRGALDNVYKRHCVVRGLPSLTNEDKIEVLFLAFQGLLPHEFADNLMPSDEDVTKAEQAIREHAAMSIAACLTEWD